MRLIQSTLLLLLMAIHCGTACEQDDSPSDDPNELSGSSDDSNELSGSSDASNELSGIEILKACLFKKCANRMNPCMASNGCRKSFNCMAGCSPDLRKCFKCGVDEERRALLLCAANKGCINATNTCPTEINKYQTPWIPGTLEILTKGTWWSVLSVAEERDTLFRFPCSKFNFAGLKNNLATMVSICLGNITTGECDTQYINFLGHGKRLGNTADLEFHLASGPLIVSNPTHFYLHILEVEEEFAILVACKDGPYSHYFSGIFVISQYPSIDSMLKNKNINIDIEGALSTALGRYGADYNKAYKINAEKCMN